jgi:hypothetical protein
MRSGGTLQAVSASSNRTKGDKDPTQWLPKRNVCSYAVRWAAIKYRWGLTIDTAEKRELAHLFAGTCGTATISIPPAGH